MRKLMAVGFGMAVATFGVSAFAADDAPKAAHADAGGGDHHGGRDFGSSGVLNFAAATNLTLAFGSSKPPTGDSSSFSRIQLQPSLDYFVIDNVSIGALLGISLASDKPAGASDSNKATTLSVGPRVGYNLWVTPGSLGLWPQLGILYSSTSTSSGGKDGPTVSKMSLDLNVPLLIHPVHHFHFGVGPFVTMDLSSKASLNGNSQDGSKDTIFGIRGEIAGWM